MAASPAATVSTRWPSLRKAISSIEQVSRRSSQTNRLAMRRLSRSDGARHGDRRFSGLPLHSEDELRALARHRAHVDGRLMRLHDLVDDGESEPGAFLELRLEGLEYLFNLRARQPNAGITEADAPLFVGRG